MSDHIGDSWCVGIRGKGDEWPRVFLPHSGLEELIRLLCADGYTVLGPTLRHEVVSLQPIESADQLPKGVNDE